MNTINTLKIKNTMNTLKKLSLVAAILVATIFTSCSKSDPAATTNPAVAASNGLITCKINGVPFTTAPISGQSAPIITATKFAAGGQSIVSITGQSGANIATGSGNTDTITMSLGNITGPGTYNINSDNALGYIYAVPTPGSPIATSTSYVTGDCSGNTGKVIVTSLTATTMEGTFLFTAKKENTCDVTKVVTEGAFKVTFMN